VGELRADGTPWLGELSRGGFFSRAPASHQAYLLSQPTQDVVTNSTGWEEVARGAVLPSLPPQPDAEGSHTFREGRLGLGLLWDAVCDRSWLVPCVFVFVCVLLCLISRTSNRRSVTLLWSGTQAVRGQRQLPCDNLGEDLSRDRLG
jgi:hypothetical protein